MLQAINLERCKIEKHVDVTDSHQRESDEFSQLVTGPSRGTVKGNCMCSSLSGVIKKTNFTKSRF